MKTKSGTSSPLPEPPAPPPSAAYAAILAEAEAIRGVSLGADAWRRLKRNRSAMISAGFLALIGLLSLFTPLLPLQSPVLQDLEHRQLLPPNTAPVSLGLVAREREIAELRRRLAEAPGASRTALEAALQKLEDAQPLETLWNKPNFLTRSLIRLRMALFGDYCLPSLFGTDNLGRDLLSRVLWGARVSLLVGIVATLVSLVIGVSFGATAGYVGGWIDSAMMRAVDVLYSIPFIFVVIFLITVLSEESWKASLESFGINQIVLFYLVIGAIYWLTMSRVVRGQVISLKHEQFVDAARTVGAGTARIIFRHIVPNVLGLVIVYLTLTIPAVMLFEAFLSFLGLGVSPPDVSWGLLVNEGIQVITPVRIYWWLVLFPGAALSLTLFALNFLGDGLRDALDPRLKHR